jgi:hypothetical protein
MHKYWQYRFKIRGSPFWDHDGHYGTECDLHSYVIRQNKRNNAYIYEALPNATFSRDSYENREDDEDYEIELIDDEEDDAF